MTGWLTWREATERALYGPDGFYHRPEGPAGHFRTAVTASALFAAGLVRLARECGLPTLVDVGAGRGELLSAVRRLDPDLELHGVELAGRPPGLPAAVGWSERVPDGLDALLVANEWLDAVPVDVAERTPHGVRLLEVDPATGAERPGGPPTPDDQAWLDEWWPLGAAEPGARAEVGAPRDRAWAAAVDALRSGVAVAVDYGHRRSARPPFGTLTGYRDGRAVPPIPDGSCDLTAHVALDACAAAGRRAGATETLLTSQRVALRRLGVSALRPPPALAVSDPTGYVRALSASGEAAELTARGGLGDFDWLAQTVGTGLPDVLRGA